jgi:hypothetical protein
VRRSSSCTRQSSRRASSARLRSAEQDFRFKFRQLLQGYLAHVEEERPVTGEPGAGQRDFERRAEAVKQAMEREDEESAAPAAPTSAESASPEEEAASAAAHGDDLVAAEAAARPSDPLLPGPDEVTAGDIAEYMPPPAADPSRKMPPAERVTLGESDDLLADVDTGVNENEFKW